LYVYGRKQSNPQIQDRTKISEAQMRNLRDTELASYGTAIAELASVYAEGLASYGITSEKITDLQTKSQAYSSAIGEKESSIADRKGARESMNALFDKVDELLEEEIDRFMELLRPMDTEFYNTYHAARVVKDTGARHTQNGDGVAVEQTQTTNNISSN